MADQPDFWNVRFAWLRYAVAWLGYACLRLSAKLPFSWQLAIGKGLGRAAWALLPARRHVAERNLAVCFPSMSTAERHALLCSALSEIL